MDNNEEELDENDLFLYNLNSTLNVKKDYDIKDFDYEWIDIIEDVLPYLDNILRNPKRFIVNEDEIVKIELAKKITVESVIHLTQHTNYIQEIDKNNDVKPSKILNINKEESLDTYENRFIFTLINNLKTFYQRRSEETNVNAYCIDKNILHYEANTKVKSQDLKISLDISDITKMINENDGNKNNISREERLQKIKKQIDGFLCTELMQTLSKLHVPPVRSPIKKTNVILKNPNFRKAEELWNYIQAFENKDKKEKDKKEYFDNGVLKDEYDQAFLITYIANKNLIDISNNVTETNLINQMIQRLIYNLLDTDPNIDEDKIKDLFLKQIRMIKEKNDIRKDTILRILDDKITKENKDIESIREGLKKGDNVE